MKPTDFYFHLQPLADASQFAFWIFWISLFSLWIGLWTFSYLRRQVIYNIVLFIIALFAFGVSLRWMNDGKNGKNFYVDDSCSMSLSDSNLWLNNEKLPDKSKWLNVRGSSWSESDFCRYYEGEQSSALDLADSSYRGKSETTLSIRQPDTVLYDINLPSFCSVGEKCPVSFSFVGKEKTTIALTKGNVVYDSQTFPPGMYSAGLSIPADALEEGNHLVYLTAGDDLWGNVPLLVAIEAGPRRALLQIQDSEVAWNFTAAAQKAGWMKVIHRGSADFVVSNRKNNIPNKIQLIVSAREPSGSWKKMGKNLFQKGVNTWWLRGEKEKGIFWARESFIEALDIFERNAFPEKKTLSSAEVVLGEWVDAKLLKQESNVEKLQIIERTEILLGKEKILPGISRAERKDVAEFFNGSKAGPALSEVKREKHSALFSLSFGHPESLLLFFGVVGLLLWKWTGRFR